MSNVTMGEMLEAGVHFGHQTRYWNPKMTPYLFGHRNKIHIINLEKTLPLYKDAINFIGKTAARKGSILFIGTKRSAQSIIKEEAQRCGMPYVNRRWLGGLLTNFKTVKRSINRLKELEAMQTDGSFDQLSKKEILTHMRELDKLNASLSGIKDMADLPDVLFVVDVGYEKIAVSEALKLGIMVVGIVDSNSDPDDIDYVIPGNDDAIRSIRLYAKGIADAVLEGRATVSHIADDSNKNEFVELDEAGAPVESDEEKSPRKIKITKKTSKKKAVEPVVAVSDPDPEVVAASDPAPEVVAASDPAPEVVAASDPAPEAVAASDPDPEAVAPAVADPAAEQVGENTEQTADKGDKDDHEND